MHPTAPYTHGTLCSHCRLWPSASHTSGETWKAPSGAWQRPGWLLEWNGQPRWKTHSPCMSHLLYSHRLHETGGAVEYVIYANKTHGLGLMWHLHLGSPGPLRPLYFFPPSDYKPKLQLMHTFFQPAMVMTLYTLHTAKA